MSNLDNLQALKNMLERKDEKEAAAQLEKEKRFLADAAKAYLGPDAPLSAIQAYDPEEMIRFLEGPIDQVQKKMGGEWMLMPKDVFEMFAYTMDKKIKKSTSLLDWKS